MTKIKVFFNQKIVTELSEIWIQDPGSKIRTKNLSGSWIRNTE
jgi:hypothetical protein